MFPKSPALRDATDFKMNLFLAVVKILLNQKFRVLSRTVLKM